MHMADALISPAVGGVMMAASAGAIGYSVKKVKEELDEKKVPLMGVMGAFVFAGQMINFTIPATGSRPYRRGHPAGGVIGTSRGIFGSFVRLADPGAVLRRRRAAGIGLQYFQSGLLCLLHSIPANL